MKVFTFRSVIIVAFIALSVYLLYPTYVDFRNQKQISEVLEKERLKLKKDHPEWTAQQLDLRVKQVEDSLKDADPAMVKARSERIKLGLDLQGGMRVVLEVNTAKLLEKMAKNPDNTFKQVLHESITEAGTSDENIISIFGKKMKDRGVRLSRYYGTIRDDDDKILDMLKKDGEDAVSRAMEIIRNRVDQFGVSEPSIQRQGARRIIVELPGVAREEEAKQLLQGTALLEFKLLKEPEFAYTVLKKVDDYLAGVTDEKDTLSKGADTSSVASDSVATTKTTKTTVAKSKHRDSVDYNKLPENERNTRIAKDHPFFSLAVPNQTGEAYVSADNKAKVQSIINRADVLNVIPNNVEIVFSAKSQVLKDKKAYYTLYVVNKKPELTGGVVTDAKENIDPQTSAAVVDMEMNADGAADWARITGANINKRIAIILDGVVYSAPVVNSKITGGRSQISGMSNIEEAKLLAVVLKAGALPAPVNIIEERTVGPSLGQDSINKGLFSGLLGYACVALFMIFYYKRAGGVAAVSLFFIILFLFGLMAAFGSVLTLPGIAGIILTMGTAVDSNVLIYERMREEQATGKTIKAVVESGFTKAFSAILDSNIVTFFSGIILYQFGTGPVQGFALTLMIGIVTSLFGNLVIARLIFDYMVAKGMKITLG